MKTRYLILAAALSFNFALGAPANSANTSAATKTNHNQTHPLAMTMPGGHIGISNSMPPLNKYGAVDVNAHVPLSEQVVPTPVGFKQPEIKPLASQWPSLIPTEPMLNVRSYILVSANTGQVLAAYNPNKRVPPASLTKLMLLYITEQSLVNNSIHLDDHVLVPQVAWATGGSRMFLKPNTSVTVKQLIPGIIVDSGNDAAVTLSMHIAGTQNAFVDMMNQQIKRLGMVNSHFSDVMGLPAPNHYSSARDLAVLARAIVSQFPQYISWFGQKSYTYNGIKQYNFNKLLFIYPYADGLKTGSTDSGGFSLVGAAKQPSNPMRLISVVMGAPNSSTSATDSKALLTYGFRFFQDKLLYPKGTSLKKVRVYFGRDKMINVGVDQALWLTLPNHSNLPLKANLELNKNIEAPISLGQIVGKIKVTLGSQVVATVPAVSLSEDPQGSFWRRSYDYMARIF